MVCKKHVILSGEDYCQNCGLLVESMTATGLREDATARQAVPPEVMASLDRCMSAKTLGDRIVARAAHLAAIAAAIEKARKDAMREIRDADWDDGI